MTRVRTITILLAALLLLATLAAPASAQTEEPDPNLPSTTFYDLFQFGQVEHQFLVAGHVDILSQLIGTRWRNQNNTVADNCNLNFQTGANTSAKAMFCDLYAIGAVYPGPIYEGGGVYRWDEDYKLNRYEFAIAMNKLRNAYNAYNKPWVDGSTTYEMDSFWTPPATLRDIPCSTIHTYGHRSKAEYAFWDYANEKSTVESVWPGAGLGLQCGIFPGARYLEPDGWTDTASDGWYNSALAPHLNYDGQRMLDGNYASPTLGRFWCAATSIPGDADPNNEQNQGDASTVNSSCWDEYWVMHPGNNDSVTPPDPESPNDLMAQVMMPACNDVATRTSWAIADGSYWLGYEFNRQGYNHGWDGSGELGFWYPYAPCIEA